MVTNQIMKRDFNGNAVSQRTSDKFFNATELLALYNSDSQTTKRFDDFWRNQNVQEFVKEVENDLILNPANSTHFNNANISWQSTRGRNGSTWMHPYLFVKFAMWLSPKFELQIIKWVYDNLIDFRVDAGDYYKEMCSALKDYHERNDDVIHPYIYVNEANLLNMLVFNNVKAKQRNDASELELALLNDLQQYNMHLLESDVKSDARKKLLLDRSIAFKSMNERSKRKLKG
jgi:hypothetical protein